MQVRQLGHRRILSAAGDRCPSDPQHRTPAREIGRYGPALIDIGSAFDVTRVDQAVLCARQRRSQSAIPRYCLAMAMRRRSSGSMMSSLSSAPASSCIQWILAVNRLLWAV
jgi:hypothetical protein